MSTATVSPTALHSTALHSTALDSTGRPAAAHDGARTTAGGLGGALHQLRVLARTTFEVVLLGRVDEPGLVKRRHG